MDIIQITTDLIDEDKDQPRYQFDDEALQELMKSIGEIGLLSPIKVRTTGDGRYKIIYGNRRYKACKMLGLPSMPCIVSTVTDEMEIYLEQIAENLTREGFSPIEEAEAFNKLLNDPKFRSSTKYLSGKLGKPESYIKNKCELLKFSNAVKKLIVSGTEIRKDKLTEDQLLPLKDLPMEHRDPLALIAARDELPVSDVKKIAKLFKDKAISESTKAKLLFKTGSGLLETWATHEQNKAERAKPAEPKVAPAAAAPAAELPAAESTTQTAAAAPIEAKLYKLISSIPSHSPLSSSLLASVQNIEAADQLGFEHMLDQLIDTLEKHLAEWNAVKQLISAASEDQASGISNNL
ncbi:ParB/RepB/Spo0J family partition protein [Paenibacillus harenae]|uniref:ParB/RepB/Spo0J family partition protein n=1 Tax=Paenibacillus harenae TaxID=306543 RepID=UPI0027915745|nr:ParB/RepB/Spo0J family partition protein [Paenibacillus harenae]MDQ0062800.1 ParB family chromosome partitioning protein [Paenibacillus harenae]